MPGLYIPVVPAGEFTGWRFRVSSPGRLGRQISPDSVQYPLEGYMDVNCRCTTAAFTLSAEPWALYAVSVRRLTALHSDFLQTGPRDTALVVG
jgi:hypothetical protein